MTLLKGVHYNTIIIIKNMLCQFHETFYTIYITKWFELLLFIQLVKNGGIFQIFPETELFQINLLWRQIAPLLHERSDGEPHGVYQREVVDQDARLLGARMRIVPLVRTESITGKRSKKNS